MLDSIMAKGGHCSRDVLKTTVGKGEAIFGWAISAATEFGMIEYEAKEYSLSTLGNEFTSQNEDERKQTMREIVMNYQPYNTILLRLKNTPENCLPKADITKAWYELTRKGNERTREDNTGSFASICQWCGLVENRKRSVILTEEGKAFISEPSTPEIKIAQKSETSLEANKVKIDGQLQKKPIIAASNARIEAQSQLNATITINITVDTKEQASVDNLLRIIRALKGETETRT
jgi:hypothetical protein